MASAVAKALITARQKCLTEDEAYWYSQPDFTKPVSARNEAAALSWLLDHQAVVCRGGPTDLAELHALCTTYCSRLGAAGQPEEAEEGDGGKGIGGREPQKEACGAGAGDASTSGRSFEESSAEASLLRWCTQRGVKGAVSPALFATGGPTRTTTAERIEADDEGGFDAAAPPAAGVAAVGSGVVEGENAGEGSVYAVPDGPPLRGLRADADVAPGDTVLHVPADVLMSYETAKESDLGKVLSVLPLSLADDDIALIWTCVERHEPEAAAAPFWAALPERFATVLSANEEAVACLEGSPLWGEAVRARQHLRDAFHACAPAFTSLTTAYPDYFKPHWFTWEAYVWAAELWYSYGIQVQFPDATIRTCLAPLLGLMNHHPLPHVVHFSKVDRDSGCLRVRAFRPCAAGCQLYLSYGPIPNSKLLLFYGFAIRDNPADEVEITLPAPSGPTATDRRALLSAAGLSLEHRLRSFAATATGAAGAANTAASTPVSAAATTNTCPNGGGSSSDVGGKRSYGPLLAPPLLAAARVLAAPPAALKRLRTLPPRELRTALGLAAAGGSSGSGGVWGADAEAGALRLIAGAVRGLMEPARTCAVRLREGWGAGVNDGGGMEMGGLARFARVYVEGVMQILKDNLGEVEGALGLLDTAEARGK